MKRPTLGDVARTAGVSYATADRVLNARGGVAEKSAQRVQRAIEELGYRRDVQAANLSRRRSYRFCFLMPHGDHGFFGVVRNAVERQADARVVDRVTIAVEEVPAFDSDALAERLDRIEAGRYDCIAVVASETPCVFEAIRRLVRLGMPVVTLVADAASDLRTAYVGIDNIAAGRTAGRLLRLAHSRRPGRILPVLGAHASRDHRDRLEGAASVLREPESQVELLPPIEVRDDPDRMDMLVRSALGGSEAITGIYSIGAGNRALIPLIAAMAPPRPVVVLHELTPLSRDALERDLIDAVIDQKPAEEVALAIELMIAAADGAEPPATQRHVTPAVYLRENLPPDGC